MQDNALIIDKAINPKLQSLFKKFDATELKFRAITDKEQFSSFIAKSAFVCQHTEDISRYFNNYSEQSDKKAIATVLHNCITVVSNCEMQLAENCTKLFSINIWVYKIDLKSVDCSNAKILDRMFMNCFKLRELVWDDSIANAEITSINETFAYNRFREIDLTMLNLSNCKSAGSTFVMCKDLENVKFNKDIRIENLKTIASMFYGCKSLRTLDLSNFDFKNLKTANKFIVNSGVENVDLTNKHFESIMKDDYVMEGWRIRRYDGIKLPAVK